jgi:DNA-binding response OmpR family regulator
MAEVLNDVGFETGFTNNAAEALEILSMADPLPHAILIGVDLPNGWALRERLKKHSQYKKIKVALISVETSTVSADSELEVDAPLDAQSMLGLIQLLSN